MISSALRAIAISITGVLALMFFLQSRLVYFPDGQIIATPQDRGLAYEEVSFDAADGVQLAAWYQPPENGAAIILLHSHSYVHTPKNMDPFHLSISTHTSTPGKLSLNLCLTATAHRFVTPSMKA